MTDNTDNASTDMTNDADQTAVMTPVPEIADSAVPVPEDPELPEDSALETPAPTGDELLEKYGPAAKPKSDKTIADLEEEARIAASKPRWRLLRYFAYSMAMLLLIAGVLGGVFAYLYTRPNSSEIDPALNLQHWSVVNDGRHNSNTDMIYWRGSYYMIHASSPWHFGSSDCKLVLHRSDDGKVWETLAEFQAPDGNDIRDPKFAAIGNRLFLYVLINDSFMATPESTSMTYSDDGLDWAELRELEPKGWLLWRPKTRDNLTWYCPAYWHEHGKSALLKSTDGENWEHVSLIYEGDANDETDCEFLPDGRLVATVRLEIEPDSILGFKDACTAIAVASPPYTQWKTTRSMVTRLDGPYLFPYRGEIFAVGRRNPDPNRWPTNTASILGRKRTALYKVEPERLVWISDLPSAGDTSYAGVAIAGNSLLTSYYTSDITRDWPWIIGMLSPSEIRIAQVHLPALAARAREKN